MDADVDGCCFLLCCVVGDDEKEIDRPFVPSSTATMTLKGWCTASRCRRRSWWVGVNKKINGHAAKSTHVRQGRCHGKGGKERLIPSDFTH